MDDIIDLELEKIDAILQKIYNDPETELIKNVERNLWENIKEKAIQGRRTGIGITAEGDMLAAMGLTYGSENATDFAVEVHKTLALEAYRGSVNLAKERGKFPVYNFDKEKNNPFIQRLKQEDENLIDEMKQFGRRNIALLTIAPTGTTSIMTQTSSGIEPVFLPAYKRRRKVNPNDTDVNVSYIDDEGDSWEEYNVFHHKFITWLKVNNYDTENIKSLQTEEIDKLVKKSPYYKATSKDVDWLNKVKMQGKIQKWVDHSISVTINLPNEATEELVNKIYITAWEFGCKGTTIYRDGSRQGVLISNKKEKRTLINHSPKRPDILDVDIVRFNNNREKWIAFVGLLNGNPYEIFTGIDEPDYLPIPQFVKKGKIIKVRNKKTGKRYDFQYSNKAGFKVTIEGLSYKFNPEFWNYAKLISGVLRHGMPIKHVVNLVSSLHLDNEAISTWKKGVERTLKQYIPNGTKVGSGTKCDNCGSDNLIYQEGCLICTNCGSSKCG